MRNKTILERREIAYKQAEALTERAMKGDDAAAKKAHEKIEEVKELDRQQAEYERHQATLDAMAKANPNMEPLYEDTYQGFLDSLTPSMRARSGGGTSGKASWMNPGVFAAAAETAVVKYNRALGRKSIAPQGEVEDIPVSGFAVPSDSAQERPQRLIELLPTFARPKRYQYRVQKVIANPGGAQIVPAGELKPELKLGLENRENELQVVAVVSEPIDTFELADNVGLNQWVSDQLARSLFDRIEREVFYSDAVTGFHGLENTTGVLSQDYETSALVTIMHGLGRLQAQGIKAEHVVLNATDWLAIQTARNASGGFDVGGPIDATAQTVWGVPIVLATQVEAGEGWVIGQNSVQLAMDQRQGATLAWREVGDDFVRNQIRARLELRAGSDVIKPHGVVKLELATD